MSRFAGLSGEASVPDWGRLVAAKDDLVSRMRREKYADLLPSYEGVDCLEGKAVDPKMRTSRPGVYAAGDVTGRDQFVYMAAFGAKVAALNALNGDRLVYDNGTMPWATFTDPQVAGVGLTEAAAKARGIRAKTSVVPLDQLARARAARDTRGLIKLSHHCRRPEAGGPGVQQGPCSTVLLRCLTACVRGERLNRNRF